MRLFYFLGFFAFWANFQVLAQDLHFSQTPLHPLHFSPAGVGVFQGEQRFSGIYRSQWASVPVNFRTFGIAYDRKFLKRDNYLLSGGLLLQNDQAGDATLSWTQIGLQIGAAHALGASQAISAGFGLNIVQRSFDIAGLRFKNQWSGEQFDPNLPTKENMNAASGFAPSLSAGLQWHLEPADAEGRTRFDLAFGANHLNRPNVSLDKNVIQKLPMRFSLSANGNFKLGNSLDAVGLLALQQMSKGRELLVGAGVKQWLANVPGKKTALQLTLATRLGDALIPAFQIDHNAWTFGISYDWNTSDFDIATNGRGGVEVALVYRTLKVPPAKTFKVCPIF